MLNFDKSAMFICNMCNEERRWKLVIVVWFMKLNRYMY